ncbi:hypothetical protein FRB97_005668 [Tulasnella sp. 331]|nr:hypothetical protein FRB97_005668 [Tulasnella sp. 331]
MADPPACGLTGEQLKKLSGYACSLPYPIEPNSEIQSLLDLYLTRITQCILAKDYETGFLQWDAMLAYWLMLKHPIPKEKRIAIARVYFNICVVPGMPLHVVTAASDTLQVLIRSKKKLTVEDMRLPWKPIWDILSKDFFLSRRQFEITQTSYLAEMSHRFFHPACGEEMLEVMLPSFNGMSLNSILATQYYLNTFLPLSHPTWLPMMMRLWSSINSEMFDERHFALLAQLAEIHVIPRVSDPSRIKDIPDDARIDEHGLPEQGPRVRWAVPPSDSSAKEANFAKLYASRVGLNGAKPEAKAERNGLVWKGLFKDIPLADGGTSLPTGPIADDQASFEFSRLPKVTWRIYSLAKLIVYSMAPDGKPMPRSGTATPFELPVDNGNSYFSLPKKATEPSYLAGCKALDSLAKLIVSVESFFHPSNSGSWTEDLCAFLKYIVFEFNKRWYDELKPDCEVPMNRRLTHEIRRELVLSLRTPALLAMFSVDSDIVANVQSALKSMTIMEPDLIVPAIIERAVPSLEALVETDRTVAVIKALGAISIGLVSRDLYYGGAKYLLQILELLLPGIDLVSKTMALPTVIVEEPAETTEDGEQRLSEEEEDTLVRDSTAGFANWVTSFIRRVILLLENLPEEDPTSNPGGGGGGTSETTVVDSVMDTCSQICVHLSDSLFDLVLDLVYDFATTTVRSNAVRAVHQLVACVANANPAKTLARFVPICVRNIRVELEHGAASQRSVTVGPALPSDATFHWYLAILRGLLCNDGRVVLSYKKEMISLLRLLHEKAVSKRGFTFTGRFLSSLLLMLTHTYPLETRFVNEDEWNSPSFIANHHRSWGRLYSADAVQVQWHQPTPEELSFSLEILGDIIEPVLVELETSIGTGVKHDNIWSNNFCRSLCFVRDALSGIPTLWQEYINDEEALAAATSSDVFHELPEFIATVKSIESGFALNDKNDIRYRQVAKLRERISRFLHKASASLRNKGDENTVPAVLMLISTCRTYLTEYADSRDNYYSQRDVYIEELGLTRRYSGQKTWPRAIFIRRARLYHAARLRWNCLERHRTPLNDQIIDDIVEWTMWPYATVRADSQACLESLTGLYDGIRRRCLPVIYANLTKGTDDDRMKGALYTLNMQVFSKFIMSGPGKEATLLPDCVRRLFECQWNEKPSIQNCASSLAERCLTGFVEPYFLSASVTYPSLQHSVDTLQGLLPPRSSADHALQKRCDVNRRQRHEIQDTAIKDTTQILLDIAESSATHWRYSIVAIRMLRTLVRRDLPAQKAQFVYFLSQVNADHPSLRYYAQRSIMKASRYIKLRTFANRPVDLALLRNRDPLRRAVTVQDRTLAHTTAYLESFRSPIDRKIGRHTPLLQDKVASGWLVWNDDSRFLLPATSKSVLQPWEPLSAEAVAEMRRITQDPAFWESLSAHYVEENHQEVAVMDNLSCVKSIAQLLEEDCFLAVKPVIEKHISDPDQNKQRGAAELLGGLIAGSKHWPTNAQDRLWTWGMPLMQKVFSSTLKTDTLSIWASFLEYVFTNKDPRRLQPLLDWIVKQGLNMDFNAESSFEAVKTMCFVRCLVDTLGWRFAAWTPEFLALYWDNIGSDHDEVLAYIADALATFCKISWRPQVTKPITQAFVLECASRPAEDDIMGVEHAYHMAQFVQLVEKLPSLRETRLTGAKAPRSPYDRMFTTVIRWLSNGLQDVNATSMFQYLLPLLPELLQAAELQDSDDLAGRAQLLLISMCAITPPLAAVRKVLEVLFEAIKSSPSWRIRLNSLPILQILYFRQVPLIEEDMVIKIQDMLSDCLSDEVIEVRERAASTLSGILRCSPRRTILLLKHRFTRQAATVFLPARNDANYASSLRQLHAAILGVTALIDAFPYSMPSWLPELIGDVLSRHAYNPIPVSRTIRNCAAKFKETHQDTWHEDSLKFNEEQMSALATLLAGPSYYA